MLLDVRLPAPQAHLSRHLRARNSGTNIVWDDTRGTPPSARDRQDVGCQWSIVTRPCTQYNA